MLVPTPYYHTFSLSTWPSLSGPNQGAAVCSSHHPLTIRCVQAHRQHHPGCPLAARRQRYTLSSRHGCAHGIVSHGDRSRPNGCSRPLHQPAQPHRYGGTCAPLLCRPFFVVHAGVSLLTAAPYCDQARFLRRSRSKPLCSGVPSTRWGRSKRETRVYLVPLACHAHATGPVGFSLQTKVHLISDEIYALSIDPARSFTSAYVVACGTAAERHGETVACCCKSGTLSCPLARRQPTVQRRCPTSTFCGVQQRTLA